MNKIIDANFFQNIFLLKYLESDHNNKLVFSDYACMESYKGNAIKNIAKSLEIVSDFPEQTIILKGTRGIVKLSNTNNNIFIFEDPTQTNEFRLFCSMTKEVEAENKYISNQILNKAELARNNFAILKSNTMLITQGIVELSKSFSKDNLQIILGKKDIDDVFMQRIIDDIMEIAAYLHDNHPDVDEFPSSTQLPRTYILRYSIANYMLALEWVANTGIETAKISKLANDFIDMNYVAYATYYDGLLTRDKKMMHIYSDTSWISKNIFY